MNISKSNIGNFYVKDAKKWSKEAFDYLGLAGWKLQASRAGSLCVVKSKTIYLHKKHFPNYPYLIKYWIVHEIAHIYSWPQDQKHGPLYHKWLGIIMLLLMTKARRKDIWRLALSR